MKPISPLSAAIAGAVLLAPLWSPDNAQAIDIKIRPAVKLQPKVAVKPRIKVSPKVVVKPKVKVAPKIAIKPKVNPAIKPKMAVTPKIQVPLKAIKPRVTVTPNVKAVPLPAPHVTAIPAQKARIKVQPKANIAKASLSRPTVPLPAPAGKGGKLKTPNLSNKLGNAALEAGAKEAAAAAEVARNLPAMQDLRDSATADLGLDTPDLDDDGPLSNQERLGGELGKRTGGGFGFGENLSGATNIPGPENSHNGKTPANHFAVTPESIGEGMAGAAGQQTARLPLHRAPHNGPIKENGHSQFSTATNGRGVSSSDILKTRPDGSSTLIHDERNVLETTHTRQIIERDQNGNITEDTGAQPVESEATGQSATELRNPDHVGGNPDCWGIDCIVNPSGPQGLASKKLDKNQVLTAAPENANPNGAKGNSAISQDQLLSRYDSEYTNESGATPITPQGACQDC